MGHAIRESSLFSGYLPAITAAMLYSLEYDQLECNYNITVVSKGVSNRKHLFTTLNN